ncbi:hypothetical protein OBBRIDRAFT_700667, partial [Obba rivulosa]
QAADKAWSLCAERLKSQDVGMVKAWNNEIDALLVFAGLFAAVLSAFIVAIYPKLGSDPGTDLNTQILLHLLAQSPDNSAVQLFTSRILVSSDASNVHASTIAINVLWFTSLVLVLSAASIGIVVRQWLNYFVSPTSSDSKHSAYIHCLRYNEGLLPWSVPEILSALPVLLQAALAFFLVGLVILLWTLNHVVALITSFFVASLFLFSAYCTTRPYFKPYCPYKSP